jgi:hypothetical protein
MNSKDILRIERSWHGNVAWAAYSRSRGNEGNHREKRGKTKKMRNKRDAADKQWVPEATAAYSSLSPEILYYRTSQYFDEGIERRLHRS